MKTTNIVKERLQEEMAYQWVLKELGEEKNHSQLIRRLQQTQMSGLVREFLIKVVQVFSCGVFDTRMWDLSNRQLHEDGENVVEFIMKTEPRFKILYEKLDLS